ncbi:sigma factor [Nonomuraea sp. NPDC050663]|uniref:sigma factor n=1 Tax=Nonomuraea sp. NPDC050663 TaxID=3364370 RepID=UPI0037A85051
MMTETEQFEATRDHLNAVAYRMLGSLSEAEDAVQETWIRLSRTDVSDVENLPGWLTTVVGRVCLDMLRARTSRREDYVPEPVVGAAGGVDPEQEALLADSVGLAMMVVLDALSPAERLAFVLHDMFAVPFDDIAPIVQRNVAATRQLASRARKRVQDARAVPDPDAGRQREVVSAFLAAARAGDFEALFALLDPDVVLRLDYGKLGASRLVRGADAVAAQAFLHRGEAQYGRLALVNGGFGTITIKDGEVIAILGFTVAGGKVVQMNILADTERLAKIDVSALN